MQFATQQPKVVVDPLDRVVPDDEWVEVHDLSHDELTEILIGQQLDV